MNSGPLKQLSHMLSNGYYLYQHHWAVVVLKWSEHPHTELGAKDGNTTTPKNIFSSNFSRLITETGLFYLLFPPAPILLSRPLPLES